MAFSLSFTSDFFIGPYDLEGAEFDRDRPTSVYQAVQVMSDEEYEELAKEVFDCESEFLTPEAILQKVQETDTCTDLKSPVEVWIDEEGYYTVLVYDEKS